MIRSFFRTGPFRPRSLRMIAWCLALVLLAVPAVTFAANRGLVVTPLDEGGGDSAASPQLGGQPGTAPGGQSPSSASGPAGTTDTAPGMAPGAEGGLMPAFPEQPSYKDGIIMAYLVELMRKQDKACPSGTRPPVPPSLLFSEPLCRVAEAVGKGAEFPAAYDEQGIYAARWRMFSASDLPAQTVATRLRAEHCEALLEPYTHIGAWHSSSGWRIVLATLTDKPQTNPADLAAVPDAPQAAAPGAEPAVPAPASPSGMASAPVPSPAPGEAAAAPEELVIAVPATASAASATTPPAPAAEPAPVPAPVAGVSAPALAAAPAAAATTALPSLETIPDPVFAPDADPTAPDTSGVVPFLAVQPETEPAPVAPEPVPAQAPPAQPQGGQEARALFSLINDLRANGGSCLGKARVTAPPLAFSATLQSEAEKSAADAAVKGSFGSLLGASQDQAPGTSAYPGAKVSKLTAASRAPVSAVLDVWMVSPTRCDALLSSDFTDAGAAYVDGYWVVLLGQRAGSKTR